MAGLSRYTKRRTLCNAFFLGTPTRQRFRVSLALFNVSVSGESRKDLKQDLSFIRFSYSSFLSFARGKLPCR
jgi:hypothetical protein